MLSKWEYNTLHILLLHVGYICVFVRDKWQAWNGLFVSYGCGVDTIIILLLAN